jgi:aerobic-type carbon monoxide dehydrogenase small subunit (CoxS/CutS family)
MMSAEEASGDARVVYLQVNGTPMRGIAEPRMLLVDFLRQELDQVGTHVGCEHGVCGACTVVIDGAPVRSCLMFAVQAEGHEIETVEGLAPHVDDELHPIQKAFREKHGLQCGFCTPGMLMATKTLLEANPEPSDDEIRDYLSGNICRCTGYGFIVDAVKEAAAKVRTQ